MLPHKVLQRVGFQQEGRKLEGGGAWATGDGTQAHHRPPHHHLHTHRQRVAFQHIRHPWRTRLENQTLPRPHPTRIKPQTPQGWLRETSGTLLVVGAFGAVSFANGSSLHAASRNLPTRAARYPQGRSPDGGDAGAGALSDLWARDEVIGSHHPEWRYQAPRANSLKLKAGMEPIRAIMGYKMNAAHLFLSAPSVGHLQPRQIIHYLIQINCHVFLPSCSPRVTVDPSTSEVAQLGFDQQTSQRELSVPLRGDFPPCEASLRS